MIQNPSPCIQYSHSVTIILSKSLQCFMTLEHRTLIWAAKTTWGTERGLEASSAGCAYTTNAQLWILDLQKPSAKRSLEKMRLCPGFLLIPVWDQLPPGDAKTEGPGQEEHPRIWRQAWRVGQGDREGQATKDFKILPEAKKFSSLPQYLAKCWLLLETKITKYSM